MHKQSVGVLLALLAMYIFSTTHLINRWILTRNAFVIHGDTAFSAAIYLIRLPFSITVLGAVVFTLDTLVADCVLVRSIEEYRCFSLHSHSLQRSGDAGPSGIVIGG